VHRLIKMVLCTDLSRWFHAWTYQGNSEYMTQNVEQARWEKIDSKNSFQNSPWNYPTQKITHSRCISITLQF